MRTRNFAITLMSLLVGLTVGCVNDVDEGEVMLAGDVQSEELAFTAKCAADDTVKGIDVSYYQGTIDWRRVKNDGVRYAFIRVSDGLNYRDSQFDRNWREAKEAGVIRGAYQFFRSNQSPEAQADLLISKIGRLQPGDLPPVIDVESADGMSAASIRDRVRRWSNRIQSRLGVKPIIYTGPYFWRDNVGGDFDDHRLWLAHYGTSCPFVPPTWSRWTFHQYTSSGRVAGISGNVDMNRFNGNLSELQALTVGDDRPRACVTGRYDGEYCDDDNHTNERSHDRLKRQLDVDFHCADIAGQPAFCPRKQATRAHAIYVLGKAAKMPLNGHPNAFVDDNGHAREKYFNAAKAYGILGGNSQRQVKPDDEVTRSTLAVMLSKMYALPPASRDYFDDDDGTPHEKYHNRVAEAGLMTGFDDGRGRRDFKPRDVATRSTLAVVAVRAADRDLVPVWKIPDACLSGNFDGRYCDDDGSSAESAHDRLADELGVPLACRDLAGQPALCPSKTVTRAGTIYVLGKAAGMPLAGHPDAFRDDDGHPREAYLNAAKAYGIITGYNGGTEARPNVTATRDMLAIILSRMYDLPETNVDYFSDDNGSPAEKWHNRVAAAGLFAGYADGRGGREFRGDKEVTRSMLAVVAVRAKDLGLRPVWR